MRQVSVVITGGMVWKMQSNIENYVFRGRLNAFSQAYQLLRRQVRLHGPDRGGAVFQAINGEGLISHTFDKGFEEFAFPDDLLL